MIVLPTQFAESSSGIGALGIDGQAFIIQLITFMLAFWVLKRYAFGPIVKTLKQRRETIENGVKLGEEMKRQQAEFEAKTAKLLHEARVRADTIITEAEETGKQNIKQAEDKAKQKAEQVLDEAERRIGEQTVRVRKQLEKELAGLVAEATEAVVAEKVDAKKDAELIEKALKQRAAA